MVSGDHPTKTHKHMTLKINHATMDAMLLDMAKAMVELRDNQNLIRCSDDANDICNDFDIIRDHITALRCRFWPRPVGVVKEYPKGVTHDLWALIRQSEDPGI
jgi:hypothetical protein